MSDTKLAMNGSEINTILDNFDAKQKNGEDEFIGMASFLLIDAINEKLKKILDGSKTVKRDETIAAEITFNYELGYFNNDSRILRLEAEVRKRVSRILIANDFIDTYFDISYDGWDSKVYQYSGGVRFRPMTEAERKERDAGKVAIGKGTFAKWRERFKINWK